MARRNQEPLNWQDFARLVVNRAGAYIGGRIINDASTAIGNYAYRTAKAIPGTLKQAYNEILDPQTIRQRIQPAIARNITNQTKFNPNSKRTAHDNLRTHRKIHTHLRRGQRFGYKPTPRPLSGFAYKPTPRAMSNYTTIGRYSSRPMNYRTLGKRRFVAKGRSLNRMRGTTVGQDDVFTKMKTSIGYGFTAAASTETAVINGNGLFDPDSTGGDSMNNGAKQPLGFDQFGAFYSHYQVMASKVKFTCFPPEVAGVYVTMFLYPSDNASVVSASAHALDKQMIRTKALPYNHSLVGTSGPPQTVKMYAKTTKILAQPIKGDMTTCGTSAANPTNLWFWKLGIVAPNDSAAAKDVVGYATVTYYVRWFANKQLSQSTGA